MAKLKAPLFSLGASGKIGDALVYFGWKGLNVVREYVIPSNPKTSGQVTQRGYLTDAVDKVHAVQAWALHPFTEADASSYALWGSTFATPRTWFNQAVKCMVDQLVAGLTRLLYSGSTTTPGANKLDVELYDHSSIVTAGTFYYGTSKTALINSKAATVVLPKISASLTGLTKGTKYYWQLRPTTPAGAVGAYSGISHGVAA